MKTFSAAQSAPMGAVLFKGKYGATRQYAEWIGETTGLPVYDLDREEPNLSSFDFLVLGSSVYIMQLYLRQWLQAHWNSIREKPVLLFTVSGSPAGHPDLKTALQNSLSEAMLDDLTLVPLRGRLEYQSIPWYLRPVLRLAGWFQRDPETRDRMLHGFDLVDRQAIEPVVKWARRQARLPVEA